MKTYFKWMLMLPVLLMCHELAGQNVAINADGSRPNKNAMLDIQSNSKGLLIPRMTTDARLRIEPTQGLVVYDVNTNSFWYNDGKLWKNMAAASESLSVTDAWLLNGNAGTAEGNFIGTLDNVPFTVRVNGIFSGRIDPNSGNTSWGYGANLPRRIGTGSENTAFGASALGSTIFSDRNTAVGLNAMRSGAFSNLNVAVGLNAMEINSLSSRNTAVGAFSLSQNGGGSNNTAIGFGSLNNNNSSSNNTAVGIEALGRGNPGNNNTAIGANSLIHNEGSSNTAAGFESMSNNTQGNDNTAAGYRSLISNVNGSGNVAIGYEAVSNNTTGYGNVGLGPQALISNVTGFYNTGVGVFANVTSPNLNNATAIGYNASVNASNKVRIGNAAVTVIEGQVPFTFPSDGRYKFGVQEDVKGLDFILQLRPVTYNFDTKRFDAQFGESTAGMDAAYAEATRIRRSGFIAQEVEQAAKKAGYNFSGIIAPDKEQQHYSLSYDAFVVPLVKAVQEQQKIIEQQRSEISAQQKINAEQHKANAEQQKINAEQNKKLAGMQAQLDELQRLLKIRSN